MYRFFAVIFIILITLPAAAREHPFLFFKKADIPAFKEKIRTVVWSKTAFEKLKREVAKHGPVTLPEKNGSIRRSWRPLLARNGHNAQNAAFLYLLTGETAYRDTAKTFLLTYAKHFQERVNFHNNVNKDGITIYGTGRFGLRCAWVYDMLYNDLTPAERKTVETDLLRATVDMVKATVEAQDSYDAWAGKSKDDTVSSSRAKDYDWGPGQWNGTLYCNTGITAIGFALEDDEIIAHGISNWKTYLARDMLNDGMWQEEDFSYSRFCYSSMITVAEMAYQYGYKENLYEIKVPSKPADQWDASYGNIIPYSGTDRGYRTMKMFLDAQLDFQYPNLKPGNWGWQMNRASFTDNGAHVTFYELGYLRYGDPLYGWILNRMDRSKGNRYAQDAISPILYGGPVEKAEATGTASRLYDHGSWMVMKSVEGDGYWGSNSMYAFMPYSSERSKGMKRLSVDLFAYGRVVAPRVAKVTRHQAHDRDYYLHEDTWNTLMVDGTQLSGLRNRVVGSRLRFHDFNPDIKVAQAELDVEKHVRPSIWYDEVIERRPQDDCIMGRALGMTDTYLFDATTVKFIRPRKARHHNYWNWHGFGDLAFGGIGPKGGLTSGQWSATWLDTDSIGMRTTMLGSGSDRMTKVRRLRNDHTSYVQVMRGSFRDAFIAIHEPYKNDMKIDSIIAMHADTVSCAVKIVDSGVFTDYLCVALDADTMDVERAGEKIVLDGHYGYIRNTGDELKCRGKIVSFTIKGALVKRAVLNGKTITVACKDGLIIYAE